MPPLMFSDVELEALMLGMLWVSNFGDASLSLASEVALAKIRDVLPRKIRDGMGAVPLRVGPPTPKRLKEEDLSYLREAIRQESKLQLMYSTKDKTTEALLIWPFAIGYFPSGRILAAWSEETQSYRHFRTESIISSVHLFVRIFCK